ncbi:MAG: hypothetical protein JJE04_04805 [Acidobacteriia bacterium]|nr:hypothetical protein [Terriglobia bacterium]
MDKLLQQTRLDRLQQYSRPLYRREFQEWNCFLSIDDEDDSFRFKTGLEGKPFLRIAIPNPKIRHLTRLP